ncbi:DUF1127 domain-containing protein [Bradyrhizobium sp. AS23.2]|uniref:DUF1127 domain-containing protein n=1 Tax=Bradyrhizobium sp. AS23.2 TaxID=1680155 RepID=UPI00093A223C|nr:DUF1127 domain-containing protein [Bradyrhizobium sp. AS23.2]OKO73769.1 hypothetical protein AC630_27875 [Bradyrhizobium sp. AS23.2]
MSATVSKIVRPDVRTTQGTFTRLLGACDAIIGHFTRRAAITTLRDLDDRSLRDIGLRRSQINAAVHGRVARSNRERVS